MRTRTLVKVFEWREQDRADVVLGSDTRLNAKTHRAQLLASTFDGKYPTTADLFVKSKLTNPKAARRLTGFEVDAVHVLDALGAPLTSLGFRIDDGTTEFYWDGGSWTAAGASDWNTEQEVADNIAAFDLQTAAQTFRIVVNLVTTDPAYTPQLVRVKVLYEAAIDSFQEDMLYRSIIPAIRNGVRPVSRLVMAMPAAGTTFDVSDFNLESGYNVVDVDAVFDFDADEPGARAGTATDLLISFVGTTITLTGAVAQGTRLWVRFIYEPEVAINTSQDYIEQGKLPAIVLDDIELVDAVEFPGGACSVANKGALTAVVVPSPVTGHLSMNVVVFAKGGVDFQRLAEQVNAFFQQNPLIVSTATDEAFTLQVIDEFAALEGETDQNEVHSGELKMQVRNFREYLKDPATEAIAAPPSFDGVAQSPVPSLRLAGSVIEGRGPWGGLWAGDQAACPSWHPVPKYGDSGAELSLRYDASGGFGGPGAGLISPRQSTVGLNTRAIGPNRVNRAIEFSGFARYQRGPDSLTPAPFSNLPAFVDLMHFRAILKDAGTSPATAQIYASYQGDAGPGAGFTFGRFGPSDVFTTITPGVGGTIITPGVIPLGPWMLIDVNYNYLTDTAEVFINGALVATHAAGSPGRTKVAAGAAIFHYNNAGTAASQTGIVGLVQGIAFGRNISLADHVADATELGV